MDTTESNMDGTVHLPGEVLARVFCHLDPKTLLIDAPAVCRRWTWAG